MFSGACSSAVQNLLDDMDGIDKASVSLMLNRAAIVYNPSIVTLEDIVEEIEVGKKLFLILKKLIS